MISTVKCVERPAPTRRCNKTAAHFGVFLVTCIASSSPQMPRFSMVRKFLPRWGPDATSTTLDVAIEALNLAKEISSVTPAKAAFGSVGVVLAVVKVPFHLFCGNELPVHIYLGLHGQRRRLRQACTVLRRDLRNTRPRNQGEERGRPHYVPVPGDGPVDNVS